MRVVGKTGRDGIENKMLGALAILLLAPEARPDLRRSPAPAAEHFAAGARAVDREQLVLPESVLERDDAPGVTPRALADQTAAAIGYFSSERVPAALLAGATVGILFAFPLANEDSPLAALTKCAYGLLATGSLCNSLLAVVAVSLGVTRLLGHAHEPMAKDPLVLLLREVPLLFLAVRTHLYTGLLLFVGAVAVRLLTDYAPGAPLFAQGLLCLLGATLVYMCALVNSSLLHFSSLGHLWLQYAHVAYARLRNRAPAVGRPAGVLAVGAFLLLGASAYFLGASAGTFAEQLS